MIMQEITFSQFYDSFNGDRKDSFSYYGSKALYDYLVDLYSDADQPYKLDVVELCCTYSEYDSLEDFNRDYNREYENVDDIQEDTTLIKIPKSEGFIIQQF